MYDDYLAHYIGPRKPHKIIGHLIIAFHNRKKPVTIGLTQNIMRK